MQPRELLDLLSVAERLKDTTRHSYTSKGRHESVAEHSWRLTLMALMLKPQYPALDMERVIEMCLIHDLGEAFTGDIPAFLKQDEDSRYESDVLERWLASLPVELQGWLPLWREMEALESPEAKLYKALDKLEALIQHNEADLSTWLPLENDLQMTYGTAECAFDPWIKSLRDMVRDDSRRKIEEGGC